MAIKKNSKKAVKKTAKAKKNTAKKKTAKKAVKAKKKTVKKTVKKTSLLNRIASHRKELEKARNKAEKSGEKLFKQAVKEIFSEFPGLKSFSWSQYTPHWNDGDECTFGCHFDSLEMNFLDGRKDSQDIWTLKHLSDLLSGDLEKKKKEIADEIAKAKENWEKNRLNSNLEDLKRDPKEIGTIHEMYSIKSAIVELLEGIDESAYNRMFGEGTIEVLREDVTVSECEHD